MKINLLLKNARIFNAYFKQFVSGDIAILDGKFLYIGTEETDIFQPEKIIDGQGKYVIPGLIDIHMHIESSMAAPLTFSQAMAKNGVTTIVAEPHEMGNVFGLEGIKAMIDAAKDCPVDVLIAIPSSVPSTSPELETSGREIAFEDLQEMLDMDGVICLGEVMNYVDVVYKQDSKSNQFIQHVKKTKPHLAIEGHCPRLVGLELSRFIFAGVDSDHTEQTVAGLKERIANGMFVEIQEKSLKQEIVDYLMEHRLYEHFAFVTDDVMPDSLVQRGHLNVLVKKAIALGMKPENAIYAATFTPAQRMGLKDRGSIAPGKIADFVLLDNLQDFNICRTFKKGQEVFNQGEVAVEEKVDHSFPPHFYKSVQLPLLTEDCFTIKTDKADGLVTCRVMIVSSGTTFTKEEFFEIPVRNHVLDWESTSCCLAVVLERHGKNRNMGFGLVGGDVIKHGAVATTYAHDHHNLLVLGKNHKDMLKAANCVIERQGGYYVVENDAVIGKADLPIAGILSDKPLAELGKEMAGVKKALQHLGYEHTNSIMSISTLSLPVSQELKLTDKGLIKVNEQKLVPLIIE
ncbi:adenine deaminase C-terminal domain-containing protein [Pelosinus sp. UFO1]|uniref:adenine deaminase C-terminal domain-containing protein n=1 Tax=Pelosinus sp. UFO1 TaxID=484770 RepID=UPI0004D15997|nr:adenine deaminase C-terminal domain-containing protein [Pelosinus sp. UFO1]AIF52739.1 Adenine deaminase [Pelosinus sp. UFO1]